MKTGGFDLWKKDLKKLFQLSKRRMVQFTVSYGGENSNSKTLNKRQVAKEPSITFTGEAGKLYTFLMSDPDATEPSYLHWLITNIPGEVPSLSEGETVVSYGKPSPPSGIHRYIFTLYEQPSGSIMVTAPRERSNFQVANLEMAFGLIKVVSRTVRVPA